MLSNLLIPESPCCLMMVGCDRDAGLVLGRIERPSATELWMIKHEIV